MEISSKRNDVLIKAINALKKGELVVYPTDTLYAIGADIFNEEAVEKVYTVKNRPLNQPIPIAVSDIESMKKLAVIDEIALKLIKKFLPGPLTLVLPKKSCIPDIVTGSSESIAIRIPNNIIALSLLSRYGPLTVTSANIHGVEPSGLISEIKMQFMEQGIKVYIDQGELKGKPSTIIDLTKSKNRIIREGVIPGKQILSVISDE